MIAIIDYGAGNIQSVAKALTHIGCDCLVTRNKDEILKADGAVLPGVGSFGDTVDSLNKYGIKDAIKEYIASGKPFLGICLGMQLLFPASGESPEAEGLGIYEGSITRIPNGEGLKIPHMGWNSLDINPESRLFKGIGKNPYVYFVHSYFLHAADRELVAATTEYGVTIDAAVERGNVFATQFHPEKSGETGLRILRNFAEIVEG
ncbi:MAG: imidazole glycerol phosphate synthase subunit HisH [Ruminococcus sp.]|nr:imidazole glycerol phosphate synthase subunit HisH [uncultured Ruminococcus sp.]MBQ1349359.1 imidazole glycerol phosphate synthase subunit HisH [Ruminococcus sp.]MBQ4261069.1 imidazole glycerol phosphate synthase subunit HisH [Ruminococcus sp.]SCX24515.1 glutamine amidotransferase [Ruminococcaceae bacterium P7]